LLKAGGSHRARIDEPRREGVREKRPVHVVLDVFLAGPDHFYGPIDLLGDLHRAGDAIDFQPPPKTAANQMIVDDDLVERQAGDIGRGRLRPPQHLVADPDFASVLAHVHRAVHRLERGMRQKRHLILRRHPGHGSRHCTLNVAAAFRHRAGIFECGGIVASDIFGAQRRMRAIVPSDHQRSEAFPGGAHVIGHHRDRIIQLYDLAHAADGFRLAVVDAF